MTDYFGNTAQEAHTRTEVQISREEAVLHLSNLSATLSTGSYLVKGGGKLTINPFLNSHPLHYLIQNTPTSLIVDHMKIDLQQ